MFWYTHKNHRPVWVNLGIGWLRVWPFHFEPLTYYWLTPNAGRECLKD